MQTHCEVINLYILASTALFGDFMSNMQAHSAEYQVFELLESYESSCAEQVTLLWKLVTRMASGSAK